MGGERRIAKKRKDLGLDIQKMMFERYKEIPPMTYRMVATEDVISLVGSFDLKEIKSNLKEDQIVLSSSFMSSIPSNSSIPSRSIFEQESKSAEHSIQKKEEFQQNENLNKHSRFLNRKMDIPQSQEIEEELISEEFEDQEILLEKEYFI